MRPFTHYSNTIAETDVRLSLQLCSAQGPTGSLILLSSTDFHPLVNQGYAYIIPRNVPTNISVVNLKGTSCYDNIWVSQDTYSSAFTGNFEVVREGLVYRDGNASAASCVSDHCPVWGEFNLL